MTRSPSKRMKRFLPWASTASTRRPARRSGQRSRPKRGCTVAISSGTRPASTGRMRLAAWWIVSPSGIEQEPLLGAERQLPRPGAEAHLDQERLPRRPDDRLPVDALEREAPRAVGRDERGERLERRRHPRVAGLDEELQAAAAALDVDDRLGGGEDDVGTGDALGLAVLAIALRPRQRRAVGLRRV